MAIPIFDINFKSMEAEKIFSDALNSPSEKVTHMSVINSSDNFEEFKRDRDSQEHDRIKYGCILVRKPIFILIILNFNFLKIIWYT